jgi:hypothetical protein
MRKRFYLFAVILFLAGQYLNAQNITWQSAGLDGQAVSDFCITADNTYYAVMNDGTIRLSTNNGADWITKSLGYNVNHYFRCASDASNNLYFTQFGGAYKSTNKGTSWTQLNFNYPGLNNPELYSIMVLPNQNIVIGELSHMFTSTNGGTSWSASQVGAAKNTLELLNNVLFGSGVGLQGMGIVKSTDYGITWSTTSCDKDITGMCKVNSKLLALVGMMNTRFITSANLGATWDSVPCSNCPASAIMKADKYNNIWAFFTYYNDTVNTGLYYSKNEGVSWTKTSFPYQVNALYMDNDYIFLSSVNGLYKIDTRELPVELTSFTASIKDGKPCLNWNTATEINNSGFEIQRSYDKKVWNNVGFVKGMGTTANPAEYVFVDNMPGQTGTVYYRLRQVDFNGDASLSNEVEVNLNKELSYCLEQNYPNPFNPSTNISYSLPNDSYVSIKVYDVLGKEVMTLVNENKKAGTYKININCSNLNSGVYFYTMKAGNTAQTKKFILMK